MTDFEKLPTNESDLIVYCIVDLSHNILDVAFEKETAKLIQSEYCDCDGFCSVRIVTLNLSTLVKLVI